MRLLILFTLNFAWMTTTAQEKQPTNRHFWHTVTTKAAPEKVWNIWINVNDWKKWDTGLKDAALNEPFTLDAYGTILSLENRRTRFKVVDYEEGVSYTICTKLPLGKLFVKRYLTVKSKSTSQPLTEFTHELWFTGISRGLFARALGRKFRKMLPEVLENVQTIAEQ